MSEVLNLFRLQNLDTMIESANKRIEEIDRVLSDNQRIRKAINALEKAEVHAKTIRINLRQIEDKVESQSLKRKTTQAALFSGKIKNPKELQDLQMESEALKRYIAQLEDEQLEAMIENEAAETAEKQARMDLEQAKGTTAEENAELLGERSKLENDLERLLREKDAVLLAIPPANLKLYEDLRRNKRGTAVATVTHGGCSTCGQELTPADQQAIRASNRIFFCPSCGRILFEG